MLESSNFQLFVIFISENDIISEIEINSFNGFSRTNVANILGKKFKYKLIKNNIYIPYNTQQIIFRVVFTIKNKYYTRTHFLPIKNEESFKRQIFNGRAINFCIENNYIKRIWIYFTHEYVENILKEYCDSKIIENKEFIKKLIFF